MELTVHAVIRGGKGQKLALAEHASVGEVLDAIGRQKHKDGTHVRVIHQGKILDESQASMSLREAGLAHGDTLLVFPVAPIPQPSAPKTWPAPNASTIKSAVLAEAKRRGVEPQIRTGRAPALSQTFPSELADLEPPMLQLLQAFGSRASAVRGGPGAMPGLAADPVAVAMQQLAAALDVPVSELHGGGRPRRARDEEDEDEPSDEEEEGEPQRAEIRPPEPSAQGVEQLTGMGFSEPVVRKALILGRNNIDAALEWLLAHSEDPDATEPPTQQQLHQVYGRSASNSIAEPAAVDQLCEMGFERPAVTAAIRRFRNVELALAYLLQAGSSSSPGPPAAAAAAAPPSTASPAAAIPEGRTVVAGGASGAQAGGSPGTTTAQQQQGDVDMDAHRQDAQNSDRGQQRNSEQGVGYEGLQEFLSRNQAAQPPQWHHLATQLERMAEETGSEAGSDAHMENNIHIDPASILGGMANSPGMSYMGIPLPADMASALQRAELEYGGQDLLAAAQQMTQLLQQIAGIQGPGGEEQQQQQQRGEGSDGGR